MNSVAKARPRGRYDGGRDAVLPAGGVARPLPSLGVRTAIGAVQDPERRDRRIQVAVNAGVDVLELERSNDRISEAAYDMGRGLQAIWERASGARLGSPGFEAGSGGDRRESQIRRLAHVVADAHTIVHLEGKVAALIGTIGTRYLRGFLVDGMTFKSYLERHGRPVTERNVKDVGQRFRDLLEDLARDWRG